MGMETGASDQQEKLRKEWEDKHGPGPWRDKQVTPVDIKRPTSPTIRLGIADLVKE